MNKYIDAEWLLNKYKEHHDFYLSAWGGDFKAMDAKDKARCDELNACIADIFNAPSIDVPTWVPCSERMPSEKEWVESYIRDKRASEFIVMIKGASRPTTLYLSKDHYWFDENNFFYEVYAWMPLPEPWKGADNK